MNWLLDDLSSEQSFPWSILPSNVRHVYNNKSSPMPSFYDYIHPTIERLSPLHAGNYLMDYYDLFTKRTPKLQNLSISTNNKPKRFTHEYETMACLGKGGFGQAYEGRRRSDKTVVVIKILLKDRILNWSILEGRRIPYEIEILSRLRGIPGIIRLYEYFEESDRFIFTMEKVPNSCTLFQFVMECPSLANTELLRHIVREIIRINTILQNLGIWHRDCKPENIIYCKNDRSLRLIDFGSAASVRTEDFHEFQGTLEIMVPEWILEKRYNGEQACVWAIGVCLYFLLFQEYPFRSKTDIVNGRSHIPYSDSSDKEAFRTMKQCLHRNGYRRPTLSDLRNLSWLN